MSSLRAGPVGITTEAHLQSAPAFWMEMTERARSSIPCATQLRKPNSCASVADTCMGLRSPFRAANRRPVAPSSVQQSIVCHEEATSASELGNMACVKSEIDSSGHNGGKRCRNLQKVQRSVPYRAASACLMCRPAAVWCTSNEECAAVVPYLYACDVMAVAVSVTVMNCRAHPSRHRISPSVF